MVEYPNRAHEKAACRTGRFNKPLRTRKQHPRRLSEPRSGTSTPITAARPADADSNAAGSSVGARMAADEMRSTHRYRMAAQTIARSTSGRTANRSAGSLHNHRPPNRTARTVTRRRRNARTFNPGVPAGVRHQRNPVRYHLPLCRNHRSRRTIARYQLADPVLALSGNRVAHRKHTQGSQTNGHQPEHPAVQITLHFSRSLPWKQTQKPRNPKTNAGRLNAAQPARNPYGVSQYSGSTVSQPPSGLWYFAAGGEPN